MQLLNFFLEYVLKVYHVKLDYFSKNILGNLDPSQNEFTFQMNDHKHTHRQTLSLVKGLFIMNFSGFEFFHYCLSGLKFSQK